MNDLTAHETAVLTAIRDSRMSFFDAGWQVDSNSWHDTFADDVARVLDVSPQAAGGVMSSLIKKGYLGSEGTGRDGFVYLTERAVAAAEAGRTAMNVSRAVGVAQ